MPLCHDGSPYFEFPCPYCGYVIHLHMSHMPPGRGSLTLRTICQKCLAGIVVPKPERWIGGNDHESQEEIPQREQAFG